MQKMIFALCFCTALSFGVAAQNDFKAIVAEFQALKDSAFTQLVPYHKDGLWGYMLKDGKQIVTPPLFRDYSFGGDCLRLTLQDGTEVLLKRDPLTKELMVKAHDFLLMEPPPSGRRHSGSKAKFDYTEGFHGFRVDENGVITAVSGDYDENEIVFSDIGSPASVVTVYGPFEMKGVKYAALKKGSKAGVISETGEVLEALPFSFRSLQPVMEFKGQGAWFYFEDAQGEKGYINMLGERKFEDTYDRIWKLEDSAPFAVVKKGNRQGVIDLRSMNWILEPGIHIVKSVEATSYNGGCAWILKGRLKRVMDYYLLIEQEKGFQYFVDTTGAAYKVN